MNMEPHVPTSPFQSPAYNQIPVLSVDPSKEHEHRCLVQACVLSKPVRVHGLTCGWRLITEPYQLMNLEPSLMHVLCLDHTEPETIPNFWRRMVNNHFHLDSFIHRVRYHRDLIVFFRSPIPLTEAKLLGQLKGTGPNGLKFPWTFILPPRTIFIPFTQVLTKEQRTIVALMFRCQSLQKRLEYRREHPVPYIPSSLCFQELQDEAEMARDYT